MDSQLQNVCPFYVERSIVINKFKYFECIKYCNYNIFYMVCICKDRKKNNVLLLISVYNRCSARKKIFGFKVKPSCHFVAYKIIKIC